MIWLGNLYPLRMRITNKLLVKYNKREEIVKQIHQFFH